jgi:hypothetical protein
MRRTIVATTRDPDELEQWINEAQNKRYSPSIDHVLAVSAGEYHTRYTIIWSFDTEAPTRPINYGPSA